jgi:eukaryotic-like serine/threonine-protein kinase
MTEEEYLDVAAAILDGTPVSWESLPAPEGEQDRGFVRQLRLLSELRRVHRDAHSPVGTTWGPLAIGEPLGIGTFGDVYKARDTALDRHVALKLLRSRAAGRHLSEGRALARVRHPNVVTVFGAAEHNGVCGIWMEFVQGQTLAQLVERDGPLDPAEAAAIGADVCRALAAVHAAGILHGDIKAQNVMREHDGVPADPPSAPRAKAGRVVLMDFGTGRFADDPTAQTLAGTPLYIAP